MYVPSPTRPTQVDPSGRRLPWQVSAGMWPFGLMVFTVSLKIAVPIFRGDESFARAEAAAAVAAD